jgi:ribosomal protein S19E (S16A)
MSEAPPKLTRRQMRVLRQIRSGFSYAISRDVRDRLKLMGLIAETRDGLAITEEGLRRIQAGK